jgi:outer membrane protein insertion porin family
MLGNRGGTRLISSRRALALCVCLLAAACAAQEIAAPPTAPLPTPPLRVPPEQMPSAPPAAPELVADVLVKGNDAIPTAKVLGYLRTRKDRQFDPELVQADKRRLAGTGMFRDVRIFTERSPQGVVVTFEVYERPTIRHVEFIGNRGLSDKALKKECGIDVGDALNVYTVEEARRKIEDFYHTKGYPEAQVTVTEGTSQGDSGAVFYISEGPLQRLSSVSFVGNTIASDERLKTLIQSKPGYFWYLLRGKVDQSKIDEDVEKLTAYYRGLGFFRARISRTEEFDEDGKWMKLQFVIDEGPRYSIRNVSLGGNQLFGSDALQSQLLLKSGDYFNLDKMNADVNALRDSYGGQGYIFADIRAEPRFLEDPGQLDLVYSIVEGNQFRVGRINVHIAGEFPHTQESVILDRLSIRPGDIIDIREVRASERRLKASQLFVTNPSEGDPPRIVIKPPNLADTERLASGNRGPTIRGQSPDETTDCPNGRTDLDVFVTAAPQPETAGPAPAQDEQP